MRNAIPYLLEENKMRQSSVLKAIKKLKNRGYEITYRKRTDGGYLITKINEKKFTGAKGNRIARSLTNIHISQKQYKTNRLLVETKIKKPKLSKAFMREFHRTQRMWKKLSPKVSGKISLKQYRDKIKFKGLQGARESLFEHQRYAKGLAYNENINTYISNLENKMKHSPSKIAQSKAQQIIDWMNKNRNNITEKQLEKAYNLIYKSEKGNAISFNSGLDNVAKIFGIKFNL